MSDFEINGFQYKSGKLNAMVQFHVSRRLAPLITSLSETVQGSLSEASLLDATKIIAPLMEGISELSDADSEYIIYSCMKVTSRQQDGGVGFAPVLAMDGRTFMFPDIDMIGMLTIAAHVLQDNLSGFFPSNVRTSGEVGAMNQAPNG